MIGRPEVIINSRGPELRTPLVGQLEMAMRVFGGCEVDTQDNEDCLVLKRRAMVRKFCTNIELILVCMMSSGSHLAFNCFNLCKLPLLSKYALSATFPPCVGSTYGAYWPQQTPSGIGARRCSTIPSTSFIKQYGSKPSSRGRFCIAEA